MPVRSIVVVALGLGACSPYVDFPEIDQENTVAACGDQVDNDFDGLTDCIDRDCLGLCDELCADRLDNDLDGLTDGLDPECWNFPVPASCASLPASGIVLEDAKVEANGEWVDDPREGRLLRLLGSGRVTFDTVLTGDTLGLRGRMRVQMAPRVQRLELTLDARPGPLSGSGEFVVELGPSDLGGKIEVRVPSDGLDHTELPTDMPGPRWFDVEWSVSSDRELRVESGEFAWSTPVDVRQWRRGIELGVAVEYHADAGEILLADLEVDRDRLDPCGVRVPPGADTRPPRVLTAATNGIYDCVLLGDDRSASPVAFRVQGSDFGPALFNGGPDRAPGTWVETFRFDDSLSPIASPALAYDPAQEQFVGAAVLVDQEARSSGFIEISSPDCEDWTQDPLLFDDSVRVQDADGERSLFRHPGLAGRLLEYAVLPDGTHRLWAVTDEPVQRRFVSLQRSRADGAFSVQRFLPSATRDAFLSAPNVSVFELGDTVNYVAPSFTRGILGIGFAKQVTLAPGTNEPLQRAVDRVQDVRFPPTGLTGAFDGVSNDQGVLVLEQISDAAVTLRFYHSGRACASCSPRVGVVELQAFIAEEVRNN
jgi:hypothetical protein